MDNTHLPLNALGHHLFFGFVSSVYRFLNFLFLRRLPALVSIAVVVFELDKVLLIRRYDGRGYSLPGGFVYSGEDLLAAVKRKAEEETGLLIKPHRLIGVYSGNNRDPRLPNVAVIYSARIISGNLKLSSEGIPEWHKLAGGLPDNLAFDTAVILERFGTDPQQGFAITHG